MASKDKREVYGRYGQGSGNYNTAGSSRGQTSPTQMSEDEILARKLQEQFDLESQETVETLDDNTMNQQLDHAGTEKSALSQDFSVPTGQSLSSPEQDYYESVNPASAAAPLHATDYAKDLASLKAFATQVSQVGCVKCAKPLLHSKITPKDITTPWFERKPIVSNSAVKCSKCSIYTCVGCGTAPEHVPLNQVSSGDSSLAWCCDQGRLFIIWVLLCLFDQHYLNATSSSKGKASAGFKASRPSLSSSTKGGMGFESSSIFSGFSSPASSNYKASPDANDKIAQRVTNLLEMIWPGSPESATGAFDARPPSVLLTMVSNSFLLEQTANLLRNDSVEDVSRRADIYDKVLSWVNAVGIHPLTANLVVNERDTKTDNLGLLEVSFGGVPSNIKGKNKDEKSMSIAQCLENLSTQSRLIVEKLGESKAKHSEDTKTTLKICKGVLLVASHLNKYMPIREVKPRNPANAWEQWQCEKAVGDVADQAIMSQSVWYKQAKNLHHSPKDRIPRIIRELANIKTSLPPGIFVRHATNRVDMWKVLLLGPSDTPYENGLFEFDVLFPEKYPKQPPLFYFVPAARYRIYINPNLHPDGKVCLSLLNTFPGPQWNPSQSTPLQILVSIQAMVFCDEPWYNEPGHEIPGVARTRGGASSAQKYNSFVRSRVVQYCILPWFKDQGIWGEIVSQHFRTNRQRMLATTQRWAREEAQWGGQAMTNVGLGMGPTPMGPMGSMPPGGMWNPVGAGMGTSSNRARGLRETVKELQQLLSMI